MGWLVGDYTKEELISHLKNQFASSEEATLLGNSVVGNHFWFLHEFNEGSRHPGMRFITVAKMQCYPAELGLKREWGYKVMGEGSWPDPVNCPVSFLRKSTDYNFGWRHFALIEHENNRLLKDLLVPGTTLEWGVNQMELVRDIGAKGWHVRFSESGPIMLATNQQVNKAIRMEAQKAARALYEQLIQDYDYDLTAFVPEHLCYSGFNVREHGFVHLPDSVKSYLINYHYGGGQYRTLPLVYNVETRQVDTQNFNLEYLESQVSAVSGQRMLG